MRVRNRAHALFITVALLLHVAPVVLAQYPAPSPPPNSPTDPPAGYACKRDDGTWASDGSTKDVTRKEDITGGTKSTTEIFVCRNGVWKLFKRETQWNFSKGVPAYSPGNIKENGNLKEEFDISNGCRVRMENAIGRETTVSGSYLDMYRDKRCIWTVETTDCKGSQSTHHTERWQKLYQKPLSSIWSFYNAGYIENGDTVAYDGTGILITDHHSRYRREKGTMENPIVDPGANRRMLFIAEFYQTGKTVPHPMSYDVEFILDALGPGEHAWTGQSRIPTYDANGVFIKYVFEGITQLLGRAKASEWMRCGEDDGSGWEWIHPKVPPEK